MTAVNGLLILMIDYALFYKLFLSCINQDSGSVCTFVCALDIQLLMLMIILQLFESKLIISL